MNQKTKTNRKQHFSGNVIAQNRRARHDYIIEDTFEAGIVLVGTEVKSLRQGAASINEAYASAKDGEVYLLNLFIAEYGSSKHFGHQPRRPRKLLLHRREINKVIGATTKGGMTLIPLSMYFNDRGKVKTTLGLARSRKKVDMRNMVKEREWQRQKNRLLAST